MTILVREDAAVALDESAMNGAQERSFVSAPEAICSGITRHGTQVSTNCNEAKGDARATKRRHNEPTEQEETKYPPYWHMGHLIHCTHST